MAYIGRRTKSAFGRLVVELYSYWYNLLYIQEGECAEDSTKGRWVWNSTGSGYLEYIWQRCV